VGPNADPFAGELLELFGGGNASISLGGHFRPPGRRLPEHTGGHKEHRRDISLHQFRNRVLDGILKTIVKGDGSVPRTRHQTGHILDAVDVDRSRKPSQHFHLPGEGLSIFGGNGVIIKDNAGRWRDPSQQTQERPLER